MTKGGSNKPTMLGRLIFGEKRKQHASPTRHRSATRAGTSMGHVSSSNGNLEHKNAINLQDWAAWRTQLNEQMSNGATERTDIKQMRQFLQANPFYQQHSRDPSNGQYDGVRLLFSIPHANLKPEPVNGSHGGRHKNTHTEAEGRLTYEPNTVRSNIDDHTPITVNSISAESPLMTDKTISQLVPKSLIGNTNGFTHINEQIIATDNLQTHRSIRTPFPTSNRVHSTLQKAVKDGNVLEKIKAFEMQAAAAQAETTTKLCSSGNIISNNRVQSAASSIPSATHRALSPSVRHPLQHPVFPMLMQHEPQQQQQQQHIRSHRSRHAHPTQHHYDAHGKPIVGRESRKGAHVLEPAHGDIILKRRMPQKAGNDEDYSLTAMSSLAHTTSQSHHRQNPYQHRSSASHSRHRQEMIHDKRPSSNHAIVQKKHQPKSKEITPTTAAASSSHKTNTRHRWLKGHKETQGETTIENVKQDMVSTKSKKNSKNKKEKVESKKKTISPTPKGKISATSLDNNRVYGVPNAIINEQTSPQLPPRIDEENESDREEKRIENKNNNHISSKEEDDDISQSKECDTVIPTNIERRTTNKTKYHKKLSSTDGEILSKGEDDTRFSRPTDDHAHRSELNDEDDECKSEGDVFIEDLSTPNISCHQQQSSNIIQRQQSVDELPSDRRWQWSKESGGLIDKGNRKKKQQSPITILTRKNKIEEQVVYETPQSDQIQTSECNTYSIKTKQSSRISPINNHKIEAKTNDFFDIGPHTNPEEIMIKMTSSS
ncbi:unnamed protein product [Adineta steineri]|uniref:Uncharacterized protein n=1 Tax=Adineta steineri TaxID=433720 RepID=A0A814DYL4_9BILA|nr:unnamed protein product [Adineta steineri]CAF0966708.1 unnamed protein product [Adineta steineri]